MKPAFEPHSAITGAEDTNRRIKEIVVTLFQMEKEVRSYGLGFSALMLHATALSFSCEYDEVDAPDK